MSQCKISISTADAGTKADSNECMKVYENEVALHKDNKGGLKNLQNDFEDWQWYLDRYIAP